MISYSNGFGNPRQHPQPPVVRPTLPPAGGNSTIPAGGGFSVTPGGGGGHFSVTPGKGFTVPGAGGGPSIAPGSSQGFTTPSPRPATPPAGGRSGVTRPRLPPAVSVAPPSAAPPMFPFLPPSSGSVQVPDPGRQTAEVISTQQVLAPPAPAAAEPTPFYKRPLFWGVAAAALGAGALAISWGRK